jgi:hypothetical protein
MNSRDIKQVPQTASVRSESKVETSNKRIRYKSWITLCVRQNAHSDIDAPLTCRFPSPCFLNVSIKDIPSINSHLQHIRDMDVLQMHMDELTMLTVGETRRERGRLSG